MALFDNKTRNDLALAFNYADAHIRNLFCQNVVIDENSYTALLTYEASNVINSQTNLVSKAYSQMLPHNIERIIGADAGIVFIDHVQDLVKIAAFEAKVFKPSWDYLQDKNGVKFSHFSLQLYMQTIVHNSPYAIWEQFYLDKPTGRKSSPLNRWGSTCILHSNAIGYKKAVPSTSTWTQNDVISLARKYKNNTMGHMVHHVCNCFDGQKLDIASFNAMVRDNGLPFSHIMLVQSKAADVVNLDLEEKSV
ncbi:hypothetical protein ACEWBD_22680 [Vibrio parahaemolyticus]